MIHRMAILCGVGAAFMFQTVPAPGAELTDAGALSADTRASAPAPREEFWSADSGIATLRMNHEPLEKLGVFVAEGEAPANARQKFSAPEVKVISLEAIP